MGGIRSPDAKHNVLYIWRYSLESNNKFSVYLGTNTLVATVGHSRRFAHTDGLVLFQHVRISLFVVMKFCAENFKHSYRIRDSVACARLTPPAVEPNEKRRALCTLRSERVRDVLQVLPLFAAQRIALALEPVRSVEVARLAALRYENAHGVLQKRSYQKVKNIKNMGMEI